MNKSFKNCFQPYFFFFFVEFGASPGWTFKSIETILAISRKDILFSFTFFIFWERGLNFDSRGFLRTALSRCITFQWDVEYVPFPHIPTYVLSYLSRKYWIISGVDLFQCPMDNIGYIYHNQEIMSLFVSAVKYIWSSNSGFL